jgi:hypothetical protein
MKNRTTLQEFTAAGLIALLVACSATRQAPSAPTSAASLSSFVLIIRQGLDGEITHSWEPIDSVDLTAYEFQSGTASHVGRIVPVAARPRDCDEENQECYRKCMSRPLPRGYGSFTSPRKSGGKSEFCRGECQQAYDDCLELERLRPQEFSATDSAVDWLRRHRTEVLVGSIFVIAGVAFVVISAGAGVVVLAPVVLMVSAEDASGLSVAEETR